MTEAEALVAAFKERGLTFGTAESLTAGLIAATVATVSGASHVLRGGVIAYHEDVKRDVLGVSAQTLSTDGVYSHACAYEMAEGARRRLNVDVAVSATGIAGPNGGLPGKPVGTVFLGISCAQKTRTVECHFPGDRQSVREQTVQQALRLALECV